MSDEGKTPQAIWEELQAEDDAANAPSDPPVAKPVEESTPAATEKKPEESKPAEQPAAQPSPVEKQLAELTHLVKTTVGRVGALQSELQKIGQSAATKVADAPTQTQIAAAASDPKKWAQLKDNFPDWGEAIDEFVSHRLQSVAKPGVSEEEIDRRVTERLEKVRAEEAQEILNVARSDWSDVLRSDGFKSWFASQPEDYRAERGTSIKPSVVLKTIREYEANVEKQTKEAEEAAKQQGAKNKRLAAAAMPSGVTPPPTKSVDDMSETEYWAYLDEQERRRAA